MPRFAFGPRCTARTRLFFLSETHVLGGHESEGSNSAPFPSAKRENSGTAMRSRSSRGNTVRNARSDCQDRQGTSIDLFDLRSIVPWDKATIEESVPRLVASSSFRKIPKTASVGQMIISHLTSKPEIWDAMISPPVLVSKSNVMIGYIRLRVRRLADVERIVAAIKRSTATMEATRPRAATRRDEKVDRLAASRLQPVLLLWWRR